MSTEANELQRHTASGQSARAGPDHKRNALWSRHHASRSGMISRKLSNPDCQLTGDDHPSALSTALGGRTTQNLQKLQSFEAHARHQRGAKKTHVSQTHHSPPSTGKDDLDSAPQRRPAQGRMIKNVRPLAKLYGTILCHDARPEVHPYDKQSRKTSALVRRFVEEINKQ